MIENDAAGEKPKATFRLIVDDDGVLHCPVCGSEFVHIGPVIVDQGHVHAYCADDIATVKPSDRHVKSRGSEVANGFWCEEGHAFLYKFNFHKGTTYIALHAVHLPVDDEGMPMRPPELWRC